MNSNEEFNTIAELDLDPIKVKLMHKESGEGWSREQVDAVEFEYRRFLQIMKLFPHEQVAPLFDVDIFWHYHILDTMKYAADCDHVFGYFLHHFPYSGLRGDDDEAARKRIGARMQELYKVTFGETYIRQEACTTVTDWPNVETAKDAFCQPTTAFCQPTTVKAAFCQPATAFCQPTIAFCQPTTVKAAFCQPTIAFCQPTTTKNAFCQPTIIAKPAFCQPATAKTALPRAVARNDGSFLAEPVSGKAITASSSQAQNAIDSFNWARPVLEYAA